MFAYCLNSPVCRIEVFGATSVEIFDGDGNSETKDDKRIDGGKMEHGTGNSGGGGDNSGKYTFKSEASLNEHFDKHNSEFGNAFSTPQEYLDAANYVIENGTYVASQNAYVKFYGMMGGANYAFVGMSKDHLFITTFHLKHVTQIHF